MGRRYGSLPSAGLGYRVEERLGPSLLCPVSRSKKLKSCDTIRRPALPLRGEQSVETQDGSAYALSLVNLRLDS